MAETKTKMNDTPVADFIDAIPDEQTRKDCWTLTELMQSATHNKPKMWGSAIVGFGTYRIRYANGKEADWMQIGFSPRKQALTLYGLTRPDEFLAQLGKYTTGKGCLYIKRLADVDLAVLKEMMVAAVINKAENQPPTG